MSFSMVPILPGAAAEDSASYLPYTGSLHALNEPGYSAAQRQRPRFHRRSSAFAELNNDN